MAFGKRYESGFRSINNIAYRVELLQDGYSGPVSEIAHGSEPLTLEWAKTDKIEPVQSSTAKLTLYSDTDRQFIDLYTIKAGSVRMDIYREDVLYWSGTLDPELYEEPYSYKDNYYVELTFSDFAILDRLGWQDKGFVTLRDLVTKCLQASCISYSDIETYISTSISREPGALLDDVCVNGLNFFDEDGEPMTIREVLEDTLRPFAMRIIQKGGKIFIYDLNAVSTAFKSEQLRWDSNDAVLGVDKVYNNVKITFSPYGVSSIADVTTDRDSVTGGNDYVIPLSSDDNTDGFDLKLSDSGNGFSKADWAKFFNVSPVLSGNEDAGVAQRVGIYEGDNKYKLILADTDKTGVLFSLENRVFVCHVNNADDYQLKVTVNMLLDAYVNPYEPEEDIVSIGKTNLEGATKIYRQRCILRLHSDAEGNSPKRIYQNYSVVTSGSYAEEGSWEKDVANPSSITNMYLCYYQWENRRDTSGVFGWQDNKQSIGNFFGDLPDRWEKRGNGEYLPMPPESGWLDFSVMVDGYGIDKDGKSHALADLWRNWHMYKSVKIDVVNKRDGKVLPQEDIVTFAWLNQDAKEDLPIETYVGCMETPNPIAKGQLFLAESKGVINSFYRAGTWDRLEKLLIGTIYSNYADRHHTLAGTVELLPTFTTYSDNNIPGVYIILSETQDLLGDSSEILVVQVDADKYQGA